MNAHKSTPPVYTSYFACFAILGGSGYGFIPILAGNSCMGQISALVYASKSSHSKMIISIYCVVQNDERTIVLCFDYHLFFRHPSNPHKLTTILTTTGPKNGGK